MFDKNKEVKPDTQSEESGLVTVSDSVTQDQRDIIGRAVTEAERFLTKARDILSIGSLLKKEVSKAELKRLLMACKRASQDLETELKAMRRGL